MLRITLITTLTFLSLLGCRTNPATGRNQLLLLSVDQTIALGEESKPVLIEEYGGQVPSKQLTTYVDLVGRSMAELTEADYPAMPWEFTVLDSDVVNAFALPGGKIFATRGLLVRLDNEAQLAGVLGHEIGHVTALHVNERISQAIVISVIVAGTAAAAGSSDSEWAAVVPIVVGAGGQGYLLQFGREQETEADRQGLKYMTAAGYDPGAMIGVLEVLQAAANSARPPEFLSTHPYPETRISTITAMLAGPYAYTQDNPDFGKFPDRYRRKALENLPEPDQAASTGRQIAWCGLCRGGSAVSAGSAGLLPSRQVR